MRQVIGSLMDWNSLPAGDLVITLFFGLTRLSTPSVTEDEWSNFLSEVVTSRLVDGFTVFDGHGQYFNRPRQRVVKIRSKILVVTGCKEIGVHIDAIRLEYQRRFNQIAVGLTVVPGYADFGPVSDRA